MAAQDKKILATTVFCRSNDDGTITPLWNETSEAELEGLFEVGLTVAGRYLLKKKLGNGSMGRVFLADDLRLDRPVAIKVVRHRLQGDSDLEDVLEREAKLGANLNHRGIASVYDFGFHEDKSYTVFEYIEGESLRQLIERRGRIPLEEALQIIGDLAVALDFAHVHGVIHRDLKPENVCFTKGGEFKILDLGLAFDTRRDVESGTYSGTPAYSSPEQAECRPTDGKSDQYALGLIAFEILTGERAFAEENPYRLLRMQIEQPPPRPRDLNPDLPAHAEQAILQSLSKDPDERFATCQEFARHLGANWNGSPRTHVVPTPTEDRIGFYIAHAADESILARQLSEALEGKQYACWYYGRDALPGVPFANQLKTAIERSQAVILLISRFALHSPDFEREIEHAHKVGCPLLPLLIDFSREEFEKLAPAWCRRLGASPMIGYRRGELLSELVKRISLSAERLNIHINEMLRVLREPPANPVAGQIWATDANQIDILDLKRVLFRNDTIDDFLNRKHRHFISATKGFGKTLLLTCKRQLLAAEESSRAPMTMIPEGRPFLDFMSEMRSLSSKFEKPLADLSTTKRVWSAAFRISAISHFPQVIEAGESWEVGAFPQRIQRWLGGAKIEPTVVFKEMTSLRVSELNQLIDRTENFLDQKLREIHGGACFFIDKVDQAIRHLSRDAWIAIQAGLIEAAWETMNANSHLKIYASIRQEAFSNYESDIKSNLFSATTCLNYSEDELQALLDQLARCYEGSRSFADFLGLNVIRHGRRPAPEDSFQYVRRHTCGRPRDLVAIASEISSKRSSLNEKRLREIVQQTSSTVLVSNIFDEVRVFLNCLDDREERRRFLTGIPANILEKADAVRVCEDFNGLEPGSLAHFGEDSTEIFHPFRDLYFAGLLGVIQCDPETGLWLQRFRRPHDSLTPSATELPDSPIFLIHPALDTYIRRQRTRTPFLQYQHIPVGENLIWQHYFPVVMQIEKQLEKIEDHAFRDAGHQVLRRVQSLLNSGRSQFARLEIETGSDFKTLRARQEDEACFEAVLWIEELLKEL